MKIPKTTEKKPYIEFMINEKGKITYSTSEHWWGGINGFFYAYRGVGNTCLPKDLDKYIAKVKKRMISNIDKEIAKLNKQKINLRSKL